MYAIEDLLSVWRHVDSHGIHLGPPVLYGGVQSLPDLVQVDGLPGTHL